MKSMTCHQLGGACDKIFQAEIFEEIAKLCKEHGTDMFKIQDAGQNQKGWDGLPQPSEF